MTVIISFLFQYIIMLFFVLSAEVISVVLILAYQNKVRVQLINLELIS